MPRFSARAKLCIFGDAKTFVQNRHERRCGFDPSLLFQVINTITNDNTTCEDSGIPFKMMVYF